MNVPSDNRKSVRRAEADWAEKWGKAEPRAERRVYQRRKSDRERAVQGRFGELGNMLLGAVLMLVLIGGLGMILKGCADFGSPFLTERQWDSRNYGGPSR
jgi:hypothetical protein